MVELTQGTIKPANINPRAEMHGDDPKAAFDLKIEATCASSALTHVHPRVALAPVHKGPEPRPD